ncbi:TPA: PerC family transcriptional regulator [Salmonella enterica subsp. enterica serovar Wandsworth]
MPEEKRKTPKLPDDAMARELEHRKLWRRAACRWRDVLVMTEEPCIAEWVVQRIAWCQQQTPQKRPGGLALSANDLRHIDKVARVLGCEPIARYWIE